MGHIKRANDLDEYSKMINDKENLIKWEKEKKEFSKFGVFKLNISNKNEQITDYFYLDIQFDRMSVLDRNFGDDVSDFINTISANDMYK